MQQKDFLISNTPMTYSCFLAPVNLGSSVHCLVPVWLLLMQTLLIKPTENKYWNKQQQKRGLFSELKQLTESTNERQSWGKGAGRTHKTYVQSKKQQDRSVQLGHGPSPWSTDGEPSPILKGKTASE